MNETATQGREARLTVELAEKPEQVREAQKLRYDVFSKELGAKLKSPLEGLDVDEFDVQCEHILVR
jgi:putative hemolysin